MLFTLLGERDVLFRIHNSRPFGEKGSRITGPVAAFMSVKSFGAKTTLVWDAQICSDV